MSRSARAWLFSPSEGNSPYAGNAVTSATNTAIAATPRFLLEPKDTASALFQPKQNRTRRSHDYVWQPRREVGIHRSIASERRGRRNHQIVDEEEHECERDAHHPPASPEPDRQWNGEHDGDDAAKRPREFVRQVYL